MSLQRHREIYPYDEGTIRLDRAPLIVWMSLQLAIPGGEQGPLSASPASAMLQPKPMPFNAKAANGKSWVNQLPQPRGPVHSAASRGFTSTSTSTVVVPYSLHVRFTLASARYLIYPCWLLRHASPGTSCPALAHVWEAEYQ